jgi:predicted dehydrogenase
MKFAIVGAGEIGRLRARTVLDRKDSKLVAVSDPDETAARRAAGSSAAQVFRDHKAMLDAARPDVVICSAPVHVHEAIVLDALAAGCQVLCEKPLTPTAAAARRLVDAATAANRSLRVGFNHRYYRAFKYLKHVLEEGTLGRIDHFRAYAGHSGLKNLKAEWMYRSEFSGGGVMWDIGIHLTDLVRFAAGEVVRIQAVTTNDVWKVPGSEDNAMAIFETATGVPVRYHATWSEWTRYEVSLEAYGDKGMVRASYAPMTNVLVLQDQPGGPTRKKVFRYPELIFREKLQGWQSTTLDTFTEELEDFVAGLRGKTTPLGTGFDGLRAIEIAESCNHPDGRGP